jgi:hypothetical protein
MIRRRLAHVLTHLRARKTLLFVGLRFGTVESARRQAQPDSIYHKSEPDDSRTHRQPQVL